MPFTFIDLHNLHNVHPLRGSYSSTLVSKPFVYGYLLSSTANRMETKRTSGHSPNQILERLPIAGAGVSAVKG